MTVMKSTTYLMSLQAMPDVATDEFLARLKIRGRCSKKAENN